MGGSSLAIVKAPVIARLVAGSSREPEWPLSPGTQETNVTVGSGEFCRWRVEGDGIAPLHFELYWDGSTLWISDPESAGVQVNKREVTGWQQLCGKLRIEFGSGAVEVEGPGPPELGWDSEKTAGGPIHANVMKFMARGGKDREHEGGRDESELAKSSEGSDDEASRAPLRWPDSGAHRDDRIPLDDLERANEDDARFANENNLREDHDAHAPRAFQPDAVTAPESRRVRRGDRETQLTTYPDDPDSPDRDEPGMKDRWFAALPDAAPVHSDRQPETAPHPIEAAPRSTASHDVESDSGDLGPPAGWPVESHVAHQYPEPWSSSLPEVASPSPWGWEREEHVMASVVPADDPAQWGQGAGRAWPDETVAQPPPMEHGAQSAVPWVAGGDEWTQEDAPAVAWPEDPVEVDRTRGETDEVPVPFSSNENPDPWESLVASGSPPLPEPTLTPPPSSPSWPQPQAQPVVEAAQPTLDAGPGSTRVEKRSAAVEATMPGGKAPFAFFGMGSSLFSSSPPLPSQPAAPAPVQAALPEPEPEPLVQPPPSGPAWSGQPPAYNPPPAIAASADGRFVLPPQNSAPKAKVRDMSKRRVWILAGAFGLFLLLLLFMKSGGDEQQNAGAGAAMSWDPTPEGVVLTPPEPAQKPIPITAITPAREATPQAAADDLIAGRQMEALQKYQKLRRQHPSNRAYASATEILLRLISERCATEEARRSPECVQLFEQRDR